MIAGIVSEEQAVEYRKSIENIRSGKTAAQKAVVLKKESLVESISTLVNENKLVVGIFAVILLLIVVSYATSGSRRRM